MANHACPCVHPSPVNSCMSWGIVKEDSIQYQINLWLFIVFVHLANVCLSTRPPVNLSLIIDWRACTVEHAYPFMDYALIPFNYLICLIFGWMGYYCTITIPKGGIVESEKVGPGPDSALGFPRGVLCTPSTCHSGLDPLYVAWRELSLNQIYPLCLSFVRHYFPQNALQHLSMGYANILRSTLQCYGFFSIFNI